MTFFSLFLKNILEKRQKSRDKRTEREDISDKMYKAKQDEELCGMFFKRVYSASKSDSSGSSSYGGGLSQTDVLQGVDEKAFPSICERYLLVLCTFTVSKYVVDLSRK